MKALLAALALALLVLQPEPGESPREIKDGILDWAQVNVAEIAPDAVIVVHTFDASEADLGTGSKGGKEKHVESAQTMQKEAPPLLTAELVKAIRMEGPFEQVASASEAAVPENALIIEGKFTTIDPGSRAKRYWAGFGAGKGSWVIRGTIKDTSGNLLAEFEQKRITVVGVFGGNPIKKLRADCERLGDDLASFLNAWATGKNLKTGKLSKEK